MKHPRSEAIGRGGAGRGIGGAAARPGRMALLVLLACPSHAVARTDPRTLFNQAVTADVAANSAEANAHALALYRQAADGGLAEAELNVAIMFDSGRGTARDAALAADYYAASATGGVARAAFDLGQLYESGDGVPANQPMAQAWFAQAAAEGLQAAANRPARPVAPAADTIPAPALRYPPAGADLPVPVGGLPLVWTAAAPPASASYFVQVMQIDGRAASLFFSTTTDLSAVRMPSPRPGRYAWRVFIACPSLGHYVPSGWAGFSLS